MTILDPATLARLYPEQASISPLPDDMRRQILALCVLGHVSFTSAFTLFCYITYVLISRKVRRWRDRRRERRQAQKHRNRPASISSLENQLVAGAGANASASHSRVNLTRPSTAKSTTANKKADDEACRRPPIVDFASVDEGRQPSLRGRLGSVAGLDGLPEDDGTDESKPKKKEKQDAADDDGSNPMLILIYHILMADAQMAAAFVCSSVWLTRDGIDAPSGACWAQGWLFSVGKLAVSFFLVVLSLHTYLGVVRGYRMSRRVIYGAITVVWVLVVGLSTFGIFVTGNGRDEGGWYVRNGTWCWVNQAYRPYRIWCEYVWILLAIGVTAALQLLTLTTLWSRGQAIGHMPPEPHQPKRKGHEEWELQKLPTSSAAQTPAFDTNIEWAADNPEATDYLSAKPLPDRPPRNSSLPGTPRSITPSPSSTPFPTPPAAAAATQPPHQFRRRPSLAPSLLSPPVVPSSSSPSHGAIPPPPSSSPRSLPSCSPAASQPHRSRSAPVVTGHHPAFFIYPVLYLMCTAPLTFGRMSAMLGGPVASDAYFSFSGCLVASHGLLNVGVWASMVALLGGRAMEQTGLDRFDFGIGGALRTPRGRRFGNMVWVEGGGRGGDGEEDGGAGKKGQGRKGSLAGVLACGKEDDDDEDDGGLERRGDRVRRGGGFERLRWWSKIWGSWGGRQSRGGQPPLSGRRSVYGNGFGGSRLGRPRNQGSVSEESLQRSVRVNNKKSGVGIQMEVVTTVVVEDDVDEEDGKSAIDTLDGLSGGF